MRSPFYDKPPAKPSNVVPLLRAEVGQLYSLSITSSPAIVVGWYVLDGGSARLSLYRKPRWLTRLAMRLVFQIRYMEVK